MTRFAHRVIHAEEIPRLASYAWRRATASPPGPVLLDLPIEVLFAPVQTARLSWGSLGAPPAYPPAPHPGAIRRAAELLRAARRPVVVTGSGASRALRVGGGDGVGGGGDFARFVEEAQIPVFASSKHSSPLPFAAGLRCGNVARLSALEAMDHPPPDLVLLLGARSGMFFGTRSDSSLPSHEATKYIQVDLDSAELGRMIPLDVGITSDVVTAVQALSDEVRRMGYQAPPEWVKTVTSLRALPLPWENQPQVSEAGKMHPYHAIKTAFDALPPDSIISMGE